MVDDQAFLVRIVGIKKRNISRSVKERFRPADERSRIFEMFVLVEERKFSFSMKDL